MGKRKQTTGGRRQGRSHDMAQAALEKPVKAVAATEGGGVIVTYEDGSKAGFVPPVPGPESEAPAPVLNVADPSAPAGRNEVEPGAPSDSLDLESLANEIGLADDRAMAAALGFASRLLGQQMTLPEEAHVILPEFVRAYPDAPAEAAFMHTRARTGGQGPKWSALLPEARLAICSVVEAIRLADRLQGTHQVAEQEAAPAEKAPPPKLEDTIFETAGADHGEDEDLRPSPTAVVTPRPAPGEESPLSAEA